MFRIAWEVGCPGMILEFLRISKSRCGSNMIDCQVILEFCNVELIRPGFLSLGTESSTLASLKNNSREGCSSVGSSQARVPLRAARSSQVTFNSALVFKFILLLDWMPSM